jgi:hypothetical protein
MTWPRAAGPALGALGTEHDSDDGDQDTSVHHGPTPPSRRVGSGLVPTREGAVRRPLVQLGKRLLTLLKG